MENKINLNTPESMNNLLENQDNKIFLSSVVRAPYREFDMEINERINNSSLKKSIKNKNNLNNIQVYTLNKETLREFNEKFKEGDDEKSSSNSKSTFNNELNDEDSDDDSSDNNIDDDYSDNKIDDDFHNKNDDDFHNKIDDDFHNKIDNDGFNNKNNDSDGNKSKNENLNDFIISKSLDEDNNNNMINYNQKSVKIISKKKFYQTLTLFFLFLDLIKRI